MRRQLSNVGTNSSGPSPFRRVLWRIFTAKHDDKHESVTEHRASPVHSEVTLHQPIEELSVNHRNPTPSSPLPSGDSVEVVQAQQAERIARRRVIQQEMREQFTKVQEVQQEYLTTQQAYFDITYDIEEGEMEIKRLKGEVEPKDLATEINVNPSVAIPSLEDLLSKGPVGAGGYQADGWLEEDSMLDPMVGFHQ